MELRQTKRTVLLLLKDIEFNITIEINCNNIFSILNSTFLRNLFTFDARALILINSIKDWSKRKRINGNNEGHLSSFCFSLMTIFFLQRINPPVLPILSNKNKLKRIVLKGKEHCLEEELLELNMLKSFTSTNKDPVSTLFLKWLIFYRYLFNEEFYCIDVTNKKLVLRFQECRYLNESGNKRSAYCLIDMFDYTYNPGYYMKKDSTPYLHFYRIME